MGVVWYNEDRKNKFLENINTKGNVKTVFNHSAEYESANDMDLGGMSASMVEQLLNTKFGSSKSTLASVKSIIRKYHAWCVDMGLEEHQDLSRIRTDTSYAKTKIMVASPFHLEQVMNRAFQPVDMETTDCLLRCMFWMVFAGIDENDAVLVKSDDVDLESMCVTYSDKSYPIYRHGYQAFHVAKYAESLYYAHPKYTNGGIRRKRMQSNYLLRGVRSETQKADYMLNSARKRFNSAGLSLTYTSVRMSGVYFRAMHQEQLYGTYDFDEEIKARAKKNGIDLSSVYGQAYYAKTRDLITVEYSEWKKAFE